MSDNKTARIAALNARYEAQLNGAEMPPLPPKVDASKPAPDEDSPDFTLDPKTGDPRPSQRNITIALGELGIRLSYDLLGRRKMIECGGSREIIQDEHVNTMWLLIEERFGFRPAFDYFSRVVSDRAHQNSYHPVRDYLAALTWDGVPRIGAWLIDLAGAADTAFVRAVSRLTLVAAVRRVRSEGCKFDEMLVLESALQGTNKSSAVQALCAESMWFGDELPFHADGKRIIEATAGKWIVEAGELNGMSKADDAALKSCLSRGRDEARMAYGREVTIRPRQFVAIGTTNGTKNGREYLKDSSGNRRYWPVEIKRFDLDALIAVRDQLWAEAAHSEATGESIRLAEELWADAGAVQESRRAKLPTEILLSDALGDTTGKLRLRDVWALAGVDLVGRKKPSNAESKEINEAMGTLGWEQVEKVAFADSDKGSRAWVRGNAGERDVEITVQRDKVTPRHDATTPRPPQRISRVP